VRAKSERKANFATERRTKNEEKTEEERIDTKVRKTRCEMGESEHKYEKHQKHKKNTEF
jgi:hypothetical protein